jgi:glycosyltransferase involved in cell wall biosynthesis
MAARLGADVTVFFSQTWIPGPLQRFGKFKNYNLNHTPVEYPGIRVYPMRCFRWTRGIGGLRWDGLFFYHSAKKLVLKLHKQKPFNVIYGKGILPCGDGAVRLKQLLKIPAVAEGIGGDVNVAPDYSRAMYRHFLWVTSQLDGAVADGKGVADRLSTVVNKEIPTIHGLVDMEIFKPVNDKSLIRSQLNLPRDKQILLFVGNLKREKGLYELIDAFAANRNKLSNTHLKICGAGSEQAGLEAAIANHNLTHRVHLVGRVDPADMHLWMQAADIFFLPSWSEGMPNVVMEAMACGLPTISTTVGGLPDGVGDSKGAILLPPKQLQQLTETMLKVCFDESLRDRMSMAACQTAQERFGLEKNVQKTLNYLSGIIE